MIAADSDAEVEDGVLIATRASGGGSCANLLPQVVDSCVARALNLRSEEAQ
jgi:hypothetical protein